MFSIFVKEYQEMYVKKCLTRYDKLEIAPVEHANETIHVNDTF